MCYEGYKEKKEGNDRGDTISDRVVREGFAIHLTKAINGMQKQAKQKSRVKYFQAKEIENKA